MTDDEQQQQQQLAALQLGLQQALEAQSMLASLTSRCFTKCVDKPGRSLSSSQQQCIWQCAQRWNEVQHFVGMRSRALLQQQGAGGLMGAAGSGGNLSGDSLLN
ncbi:tim10/DDP zinc finger domain-containing protein, putative [Eimeria tenella]|uniref:Mitochondrial import inner membrane translocase subunit n=1 Tax=Eimeria tenella TaxID=5802 RepID=U6L1K4_EIMTE|nr:tim10/DDP zinc finger domain-containing protein, putative [Eimeria tenella]CDJ43073.1 tim10/DDP zinc finger domain-containing protein, putative [Eimeria tenella]|eukprot:XP_013233823.1 tim10/DDP zinc finger domain-containing protein, putative [Eimeria tenella]